MEKLVEQLQALWEEHRSQIYVVIGLVLAVGFGGGIPTNRLPTR